MESVEINLPGGVPVGDEWCRSAWLRPVTGHEEEFLLQEGRLLPAAMRVTHLITRCLRRLGPVEPVGAEMVRRLSVGDREALLLHLRHLTLGGRISCLLVCPQCGKKMDMDLQIHELLVPPYAHAQRLHETEISDPENRYRVVFRVPSGEDQEAAAALAAESVDSAAELLLRRCIERVIAADGKEISDLPEVILQELPKKMAELDPQAEVLLDLTCPECNAGFVVPFDAGDYVCREFAVQEREFYREVHALSFHYHWNEDAVLSLSRRKRRIYLDLLADELARGGRSG
ncbi:MAG TPA: hypothetical protein VK129_06345 [Terriglobales bacterium]|nr:hypothetical protein [Terriglobales bacterium]